MLITNWIAFSVQVLLGHPLVNPQQDLFTPRGLSWVSIIGIILFVGVAVPFAEELFSVECSIASCVSGGESGLVR